MSAFEVTDHVKPTFSPRHCDVERAQITEAALADALVKQLSQCRIRLHEVLLDRLHNPVGIASRVEERAYTCLTACGFVFVD